MGNSDYHTKKTFVANFWKEFKELLGKVWDVCVIASWWVEEPMMWRRGVCRKVVWVLY